MIVTASSMRRDPYARRIERHARLFVVGGHPSGAEPDLDPTVREVVDGGELLGQDERVAIVVVEDEHSRR